MVKLPYPDNNPQKHQTRNRVSTWILYIQPASEQQPQDHPTKSSLFFTRIPFIPQPTHGYPPQHQDRRTPHFANRTSPDKGKYDTKRQGKTQTLPLARLNRNDFSILFLLLISKVPIRRRRTRRRNISY
jgi:hypothetical protein